MSIKGSMNQKEIKGRVSLYKVTVDKSLTKAGQAADAKITGDALDARVKRAEIADNLTTDNPLKVLSARQGVELKRQVDELRENGSGATEEQIAQIETNKNNISNLSERKVDKTNVSQMAGESEVLIMSQKAVTQLVSDALGTNKTEYETVDSVDEMTDTSKSYVLSSTGTIWAYGETEPKPNFTNLATTFEHGRLNSSGDIVTTASSGAALAENVVTCTDYIPFANGDVVRIKGYGSLSDYNIVQCQSNGTVGNACKASNIPSSYGTYEYDSTTGIVTLTCVHVTLKQLRVSGILTGTTDDVIITLNEEITYSAGYEWYDTEMTPESATSGGNYVDLLVKVNANTARIANVEERLSDVEVGGSSSDGTVAIPSYWESMVAEKTETIKSLQMAGGKDCVCFAWASDTHIPDSVTDFSTNTGVTTYLGRVMARMLDNCEIPFAILSGDINTRASYGTEDAFVEKLEKLPEHLAPLWGTDRLLMALGNHDGAYGDSTCYYRKQFPPERMWQIFFRSQALDFRRVFSDDGLYFYVDNIAQKTRFIVLNSHYAGEYSVDSNGLAVNNRFSTSCYGQAQLDWLADVALNMPEGYSAIITAHVPPRILKGNDTPYTVDSSQLKGIINAYCNKTTFSGSYTAGVNGWTNSTVNVDFTNAKGEIIAMFAGHIHWDTIDTETLACPLITIIAGGATVNEHQMEDGEVQPTRTRNTDTETSFDVVTINKATRTIYCTRVGGGSDRVISY